MKRIALAAFLLTLLAAPAARAAGMGLRWNSCEGAANRNFACDRNTGTEILVASFAPPGGITELTGIEAYFHITATGGKVPMWWQMFESGTCRRTGISAVLDVSDQLECSDPWEGIGMGGIARYKNDGANGVDLLVGVAIDENQRHALSAGQTYAAFKLVIQHRNTSGPGACGGCEVPACIAFERMVIAQYTPPPHTEATRGNNIEISLGLPATGNTPGNVATWQGGTANCGAGLSRPASWQQVKDRFRNR
ncbi:MAG: hypothetical protein ABL977_17340 [Candidatus Eisenbacteria bacterium]